MLASRWSADQTAEAIRANRREPVWVWKKVGEALDTGRALYFPRSYDDPDRTGMSKDEVMRDPGLCAVPGWSVGLVEPEPVACEPRGSRVVAGRRQLEGGRSPREYLRTLQQAGYEGESGWTAEDFLVHFVTRLEETSQVSHDRHDGNALWLLGVYLPNLVRNAQLVPVGYWDRNAGQRLRLTAHRTGNSLRGWVPRTMVRLPGGGRLPSRRVFGYHAAAQGGVLEGGEE